ncbi:MAG TPA: hypothetical protein VGC56_06790 [Allosphingosinicella sp.]|jgi:hypothetical protein
MWNIIYGIIIGACLLAVSLLIIVPYSSNLRRVRKGEVEVSGRLFTRVYNRSEQPFTYWMGIAFTILMTAFGLFILVISLVVLVRAFSGSHAQ